MIKLGGIYLAKISVIPAADSKLNWSSSVFFNLFISPIYLVPLFFCLDVWCRFRTSSCCPSVRISSERGEWEWRRSGLNWSFSNTDRYRINVCRLETSLWWLQRGEVLLPDCSDPWRLIGCLLLGFKGQECLVVFFFLISNVICKAFMCSFIFNDTLSFLTFR